MNYLKQNTAATIKVGPLVATADGTLSTGLTIQKADVRLSKNGAALAATHADQGASNAGAAYDAAGMYTASLDATDTNTLGRLTVTTYKSGAAPVRQDFAVVSANVFAQLVTSVSEIGDPANVNTGGRIWHVNTVTGSDSNDGLTDATALATLAAAAAKSRKGDKIVTDQPAFIAGTDFSAIIGQIIVR